MILPRIIPCLLLKGKGLVKGIKFKDHTYVGDPINAIRIFNEKEVDELIFLDITATAEKRIPPLDLIQTIADQCLMPFVVGGGITTLRQARDIFSRGAEKVCINTATVEHTEVISTISDTYGVQSVVAVIDYKKNWLGQYHICIRNGRQTFGKHPVEFAVEMASLGAGEIMLNAIDRDGTQSGYDIDMIRQVSDAVSVPVIACGGAGNKEDLGAALKEGRASAAAAGSLFVFHGRRRAVLINFPSQEEREWIYENVGYLNENSD